MIRSVCIISFLLLLNISFSQEGDTKKLLIQAENIVYSNPNETIRIAEYVSTISEDPDQLTEAAYLLTRSYYIEGKYDKALKIGFKVSNEGFENENNIQLKTDLLLTRILSELELNELAKKQLEKAIQASHKIKNENTLNYFKGEILELNIDSNSQEDTSQHLERLYSVKNILNKTQSVKSSFQIGLIDLEIAAINIRELQLDSVPNYLESVFLESKKVKPGNYLEMKYLLEYGNYLFLKREHEEAIESLEIAQQIAEKLMNIAIQFTISQALADNYLALGDLENFNIQNKKTKTLDIAKSDLENNAVSTAFNIINDNEALKLNKADSFFLRNLMILSGVLLLILIIWGGYTLRYRIKTKQYQSFIDYFEKKQMPEAIPLPQQKPEKQSVVPKDMEKTLIEKLNNFENSTDFTNQDTSLSRLALQFDTNTKYLSEVVNSHKMKNFNSYINELRVNYIIDKLKNNPSYLQYKISYLAEESGFSSHSVFATVFKQVTGIPPTRFITILKDKKEEARTKANQQ